MTSRMVVHLFRLSHGMLHLHILCYIYSIKMHRGNNLPLRKAQKPGKCVEQFDFKL